MVPGPLGPTTSYQQQLTADCFSIQPAYSPQIRVSQRLAGAAAAAEADAGGGCGARLLLQAGKQDQQQQLFAGQQEGVVPGSRHTADAACDSHQQAIGGGQAALQQLLQHSSCAVDIAEGDSRQAQQQWQAFQQDQQPHQQQHWVQHQEQLTVQQRVQDHSFATHWYTGQGNDHWNSLHVAMQQQQQTRQEARLVYLKRLSSALKGRHSCSSVEQLSSILVQHGRYMDGQALTAAFTAAARLAKQHAQLCGSPKEQQRQQLTLLVQQVLLPLLRRKLGLLDVVGLVLVLQALGALQCAHDDLIVSDVVRKKLLAEMTLVLCEPVVCVSASGLTDARAGSGFICSWVSWRAVSPHPSKGRLLLHPRAYHMSCHLHLNLLACSTYSMQVSADAAPAATAGARCGTLCASAVPTAAQPADLGCGAAEPGSLSGSCHEEAQEEGAAAQWRDTARCQRPGRRAAAAWSDATAGAAAA